MKDKALRLALDALESGVDTQIGRVAWTEYDSCLISDAITAIKEALAQPAPVQPVAWMEMVVANLVREGVNKHKARELAEHFYTTPPAQRTWVGLTDEETDDIIANAIDKVDALIQTVDKLKEKNT
jgi:hypothetical protein